MVNKGPTARTQFRREIRALNGTTHGRMAIEIEAGMVARACNFTTWEAGARG